MAGVVQCLGDELRRQPTAAETGATSVWVNEICGPVSL
jgi:hypothetical protein